MSNIALLKQVVREMHGWTFHLTLSPHLLNGAPSLPKIQVNCGPVSKCVTQECLVNISYMSYWMLLSI